jgi:hypothetical protein
VESCGYAFGTVSLEKAHVRAAVREAPNQPYASACIYVGGTHVSNLLHPPLKLLPCYAPVWLMSILHDVQAQKAHDKSVLIILRSYADIGEKLVAV